MNNFIFKSPRRLIKNSSEILDNRMGELERKLSFLLGEQRHQRSDLKDIKLMLNKLLINKHLQEQVDDYFDSEDSTTTA